MNSIDFFRASSDLGKKMEWGKWSKEIPAIEIPDGWKIQVVPPFNCAVCRFILFTDQGARYSVYLDCYDVLGFVGEPYWEVYCIDGDTFRCPMMKWQSIFEAIKNDKGKSEDAED